MAASLYKAQFALTFCENHDKKELIAYCKTCREKICSSCIKEEHNQHDWEMISDILREKKHNLPKECKEIRAEKLPRLKQEVGQFDRKIKDEVACFEQNKSTLNDSRQSYISEINQLFDYRIDECRQKSESAIQIYKVKREGLKQKVEYLDMVTTALDKDINTLPDHDILDMEKEMRDELEKAFTYSANQYTCNTVYVPGKMDKRALRDMVGEIHSVSVEEKHDMDIFSDTMISMKAISDSTALAMVLNDNYAKLIESTGDILKTMKTPCTDLIVLNSGEFVLIDKVKCNVSVLTEDENMITTIDTEPLHPTCINKADNYDILVTLRDNGDRFNLVPTSRRVVQRMTLTGEVLHTYEFREDGETRLFTWPLMAVENNNMDICVVNRLSDNRAELVVLHKDGSVRFVFEDDGLKTQNFFPIDVECDSKCRILFTEYYSRAIHMLSPEGMYLCTLCQYDQLLPYVISIHGENLWCGFFHGSLKVLKYTN
ncbi:hypothetical protein FSP39_014713 [Pinctada imbricata]|uniref:B box-type domain-containing protein n=1 Tax=Pinctada imbricata TaxID=66713 RepID=A0AA89C7N0_PINIB|nr:hypothetical protein FSP39_014713 [Pinctada imbricata]